MVNVRGLTRKELGAMNAKGFPIDRWGVHVIPGGSDEKAEQMFDEILRLGTGNGPAIDLEQLTPNDERKLYIGIMKETFGAEDEEKNLPRSGNGSQTQSGLNTANDAQSEKTKLPAEPAITQ